MIVLNGIISSFDLSGLLRFLYSAKKTGILTLVKGNEKISVHILSGKPVGVISDYEDVTNALTTPSTWLKGEFSFDMTEADEIKKNLDVAPDKLLLSIVKKEKEIKEIMAALPSFDTILLMNTSKQNEEIRLQPDEWNVLSKVDGKKTLEKLVESLDMSPVKIYAMVVRLLQKNVLQIKSAQLESEKHEENTPAAAPDFEENKSKNAALTSKSPDLDAIEKVFVQYVGPMGSIILDEVLDDLSLDREGIKESDFPEVIRKISLEIEEEEERSAFEEELIQKIKT